MEVVALPSTSELSMLEIHTLFECRRMGRVAAVCIFRAAAAIAGNPDRAGRLCDDDDDDNADDNGTMLKDPSDISTAYCSRQWVYNLLRFEVQKSDALQYIEPARRENRVKGEEKEGGKDE